MKYSFEAVKNILNQSSCLDCFNYNIEKGICKKTEEAIPEEFSCDLINTLDIKWTKAQLDSLEHTIGIDVEEELIKAVSKEVKEIIDKEPLGVFVNRS